MDDPKGVTYFLWPEGRGSYISSRDGIRLRGRSLFMERGEGSE